MGFVKDGLRPGNVGTAIGFPVIGLRIDDPAFGHAGSTVAVVEGQVLVLRFEIIGEMRARPGDIANQFARIGVDQKLVGIEAMAVGGIVGAVNAVAVERAGLQAWNVAVPDFVRIFRQLDARRLDRAAVVEQAEFDPARRWRKTGRSSRRPYPGRRQAAATRRALFYAGSPWHPRAKIPSVQNLPHPIVQRIILFRPEEPGMQIFRCPAWDQLLFAVIAAISFIRAAKTANIIFAGLMS